ncbi:uncharacterized protein METZ01_LOCUS227979 [marine metagenome]|uniref:Uncharacterized protein n=1 Tax=marine metagenome TaxID=408172 RepID=A0A382GK29_9ZZZZ
MAHQDDKPARIVLEAGQADPFELLQDGFSPHWGTF